MLQTSLDLRSVVPAAAAGRQHCGEPQRSGQEDQANPERTFVHRLDSPAVQKGSQARERDAPVDLPIVGEGIHVAAAIRSKLRGMKTINPAARQEAVLVSLAAVYPVNEWTNYPSAASRRRASSVYSISRSLTERPRRSASAASRSASSIGRTTVRRTQSSLSQTSSGVSDKLSPLGHNPRRRLLKWDVAAQDAVAQKAQTAEIREARPLR